MNANRTKGLETTKRIVSILCGICCAACCVYLIIWFIGGQSLKARNRKLAEEFHSAGFFRIETDSSQQSGVTTLDIKQKMDELRRENGDTVGWIHINGTEIDYPIVRHKDNEYYLNRNFWGEEDRYGAIFMDSANTDSFDAPHVILYGHNMKDGAMFGGLIKYLDADYLRDNSVIAITLPDGNTISYRVFAAKQVYADDPVYQVDFEITDEFADFAEALGAPDTSASLLTLSTCANGVDYTARVVIHACLEDCGV